MAEQLKLVNVVIIIFILPFLQSSELPAWHMKPFGSHVKPESVDETLLDNMITPEDFASKYVLPRKPIIFRNVVKTWPAFKLWTDEYLAEKYGEMEMRLEAKKEKKGMIPKGDVCLGRDRLKTFLNDYRKGADKYIVSDLPTPMWSDVNVPPPMACGDFLKSYVEIDLWVNSDMGKKGNGGNSIIHKDAFNTVNCIVNGSKEWKLIELQYNDYMYQSWEGPMDAGYGGFSLINPDKVDATEFPNVGQIPRWQFANINAGDCIYLPSQMWHQVKSYGETNRAVAFLFSQFEGFNQINTSGCGGTTLHVPLSEVDVDWPYPGKGIMPMGNGQIEEVREYLLGLVDRHTGLITPKGTYRFVYNGHEAGATNKKLILQKAKSLYTHLLQIAEGKRENVTQELIENLTRDQIRFTYNLVFPAEPANTYDHEYSSILPEELTALLNAIKERNNGKVEKKVFLKEYQDLGGTHAFAEDFWKQLAGDKEVVEDITQFIDEAVRPYEEHRRDRPDVMDVDDDATITTPQGHVSQPKRKKGVYSKAGKDDEVENAEGTSNIDGKGRNEKDDVESKGSSGHVDNKYEL